MELSLEIADGIARAAIAHSSRTNSHICVAVTNAQARIVVFFKMDRTHAMDGHEAMRRAITSASTGRVSQDAGVVPRGPSSVGDEGIGLSQRPGGLPLVREGRLIGAIGVCADEDHAALSCAQAGVDALTHQG